MGGPSKKARIGGQVPVLRPRIRRPLDAPKAGDRKFVISRLVHPDVPMGQLVGADSTLKPVTDATGYQVSAQLQFSLNQLPNYAAWTACFDEYRIVKCEVEFMPRWTTTGSAGTAVNHHILGYFPIDYPVAFPLTGGGINTYQTTEGAHINRVGYRQVPFDDKPVRVTCYPSPELGAIDLTNTDPVIGEPSTWLKTSTPATPHYGLIYRVYSPQATSADQLVTGEVYVRYYVEFRQAK